MCRWVDLHEQAEKEGGPHGTPQDPLGPLQDSLPGIRLLSDEYTMRRLAKVSFLFFFFCLCQRSVHAVLPCHHHPKPPLLPPSTPPPPDPPLTSSSPHLSLTPLLSGHKQGLCTVLIAMYPSILSLLTPNLRVHAGLASLHFCDAASYLCTIKSAATATAAAATATAAYQRRPGT